MTPRKVCKGCDTEKPLTDFYKHTSAKDGRQGYCKVCYNNRRDSYRYGECDQCGGPCFLGNGYTTCRSCRNGKRKKEVRGADAVACHACKFEELCKVRVMQTDVEHRDWSPPCFVTSHLHAEFVKEYSSVRQWKNQYSEGMTA